MFDYAVMLVTGLGLVLLVIHLASGGGHNGE